MMIGRIEEKQKLLKANGSEYSQFVTVYGRRRVGKTFFVRETFCLSLKKVDSLNTSYYVYLSNVAKRQLLSEGR